MAAGDTYRHVPFNRDAEVAALGRAIVVERRARYTNFRGRRSTFSQFMRQTADRLCRRYPMEARWATIRGLFQQYANLDVSARISILRRTEELLVAAGDLQQERPGEQEHTGAGELATGAVPGSHQRSRPDNISSSAPDNVRPAAPPRAVPERASVYASLGAQHINPAELNQPDRPSLPGTGLSQASALQQESASSSIQAGGVYRNPVKDLQANRQDPALVAVQFVKGVGPKMAAVLQRLGIHTALDLIRHYPRHHLDFQDRLPISELSPGQEATVFGSITSVGAFQSKKRSVSVLTITIGDGTGKVQVSRFIGGKANKHLLDRYKSQYPRGAQVLVSGKVERDSYGGRLQMRNAEVEILSSGGDLDSLQASLHTGRLVPVYPLTEGIGLRYLRTIIHNALEAYQGSIEDTLPADIRRRHQLLPLVDALWGIHFPADVESKEEARRRLVFDELFALQLQLAVRRHRFKSSNDALALEAVESGHLKHFRRKLPFQLTGAQERVLKEIAADLASTKPMHRLVQGDVGSGKTVVAAMAALIAIDNGYQVAVMAPTEILAEQHFRSFEQWFASLGLRCGLFLGRQGVRERRLMQQDLRSGQIHAAIGTHALLEDDIEFNRLGLIIIDEQHRFGVKQRARLKAKGINPELLTMTATPIPRTLALTLHGDLDVSEIDELPPGRKPVETRLIRPAEKRKMYRFILEQVVGGRQAYIVFPLIDESETLSAKAASAEFEKLKSTVFAGIPIGLMHGKLKPQEKEDVMERFRCGDLKILICTTVIEVGVDVPNASVMVIENADRFGLAQLHQLRGRVGRGAEQSYCFLISSSTTDATMQRLEIMTQTNDGFVIAERDLKLRGPGEFLGVRQSGMPDLLLADIVSDARILEEARAAAIDLVRQDPDLKQHRRLKDQVNLALAEEKVDLISSG